MQHVHHRLLALLVSAFLMLTAYGCGAVAFLRTEVDVSSTRGQPFDIRIAFEGTTLAVVIDNRSDKPIEVQWDRTSIVGPDGVAHPVLHSGGRSLIAARDISGSDVTAIPPRSSLADVVAPKESVYLGRGGFGIAPVLAINCGRTGCDGLQDAVGKTVRLSLALLIDNQVERFDLSIRVTDAYYTLRGSRDVERR